RVPADERLRVVEGARQRRHGAAIGDVAQGDAHIAKQSGASRSPQRALAKVAAECRVVECQQFLEAGPSLDDWPEGGERRRVGRRRPSIDRTDLLTEVATEDPVA